MTRKARAGLSFWILVAVATAASGGLSAALAAPASPRAGLGVAFFGAVLAMSLALALAALQSARAARRGRRMGQVTGRRVVTSCSSQAAVAPSTTQSLLLRRWHLYVAVRA